MLALGQSSVVPAQAPFSSLLSGSRFESCLLELTAYVLCTGMMQRWVGHLPVILLGSVQSEALSWH